jgi:alpha-tubulin suppressor-like RCC1 family protein
VEALAETRIVSAVAGPYQTVAVAQDGTVYAFGDTWRGGYLGLPPDAPQILQIQTARWTWIVR